MQYDVFISYSSHDKAVADAACAKLESQRIRCWIAPRDILPGMEYGEAIVDAIDSCRVFAIVFSTNANNSPLVRREVERAMSKGKVIVPFRIENTMPSKAMEFALSNTHWLDALTPPLEAHLENLARTVHVLLGDDRQRTANAPHIRLTVHFASFFGSSMPCCFINATNICHDMDVEITHVWIEAVPKIHVLQQNRPLPKRLKPRESWETWLPLGEIPSDYISEELHQLARVRLSTGDVISSVKHVATPEVGSVPGGAISESDIS